MIAHAGFHCRVRLRTTGPALTLSLLSLLASAADWPQYAGPNHNNSTPDKVAGAWPTGGPKLVWKVQTPTGFSVFSVAGGRAYTLVSREADGALQEVCLALDAATGKELWATPLGIAKYDGGGDSGTPTNQGGDGPRSTPTVDGDRVYVLDARLKLHCLEAAKGQPVWTKDFVQELGAKGIQWQNAASPVVEGDLIFVCCGAPGKSLLGLRKTDGSLAWSGESDVPTHATPTLATLHGVRQIIFFTRTGLVACETQSGKVLWRQAYRFSVSTAASPVVAGDIVYCSAGYGVGTGAYRIAKDGDRWTSTEIWRITGDELANHWSTPVVKDGYVYGLYGFKQYGKAALKCLELATGKQKWSEPGFGPGGVILAGGQLVVLNDRGEVVLVAPQPDGYQELARTKAVAGKCWNHPVVSGGRIYARSTTEGACLDVTPAMADRAR